MEGQRTRAASCVLPFRLPLMTTPTNRLTPDEVRAFFNAHRTVRRYKPEPMPEEHLDVLLHAAQRAPTDATAQMYSFIRLVNPQVRERVAALTLNAHVTTAAEAFVVCMDVHRLRLLLERGGHAFGEWPAVAVHFGIGDAVLAGQNMLLAAEMLGYQGCWIGGVLTNLPELTEALALPEGVLPYAALTVGLPDETPAQRPRIPRTLVLHEDAYREPIDAELDEALAVMAPITARGDWAQTLARYFAAGGGMEGREGPLRDVLRQQGLAPRTE